MSTIVLATDLTDASAAALAWSVDLARRLSARLLVVHVLDLGRLSGRAGTSGSTRPGPNGSRC